MTSRVEIPLEGKNFEFFSYHTFRASGFNVTVALITSKRVCSLEDSNIKAFGTDAINSKREFVRFDGVQRIQHRSARIMSDFSNNNNG